MGGGGSGGATDGGTGAACNSVQPSLLNGDFESGEVDFCSDYILVAAPAQITTAGACTVAADPSKVRAVYTDWVAFGDHTSGHGKMLICDAATTAGSAAWKETIPVTPGTSYLFTFWVSNVEQSQSLPTFQAYVNSTAAGPVMTANPTPGAWTQYSGNWSSGINTTAALSIFDQNTSGPWNDFAVDDISFTEIGDASSADQ
jgi:hypothetical protein